MLINKLINYKDLRMTLLIQVEISQFNLTRVYWINSSKSIFKREKEKRNKESKSIRMTLTKNFQRENHSQCEKKILKDLIQ